MSSISSRRLSRSSLIFLPFLASSGLAPAASSPPSGLVGLVSFFFCSAMNDSFWARTRARRRGLDRRQDDPLLALVLPLPVRVGRLAGHVGFEEKHLRDTLVRIDLGGQGRGIADLERQVALPLGL